MNPWLFNRTEVRFLHIAPERCITPLLRRRAGSGYLSADLFNAEAMEKMDICDIDHPDGAFDAIYCSHVLEHVPDDKQAMRELRRVLRPGGWAAIMVPITVEQTFEDPTVEDPAERLRLFGQEDHVRRYGVDIVERLKMAGFDVDTYVPASLFLAQEVERFGLGAGTGEIFLCRPAGAAPS